MIIFIRFPALAPPPRPVVAGVRFSSSYPLPPLSSLQPSSPSAASKKPVSSSLSSSSSSASRSSSSSLTDTDHLVPDVSNQQKNFQEAGFKKKKNQKTHSTSECVHSSISFFTSSATLKVLCVCVRVVFACSFFFFCVCMCVVLWYYRVVKKKKTYSTKILFSLVRWIYNSCLSLFHSTWYIYIFFFCSVVQFFFFILHTYTPRCNPVYKFENPWATSHRVLYFFLWSFYMVILCKVPKKKKNRTYRERKKKKKKKKKRQSKIYMSCDDGECPTINTHPRYSYPNYRQHGNQHFLSSP